MGSCLGCSSRISFCQRNVVRDSCSGAGIAWKPDHYLICLSNQQCQIWKFTNADLQILFNIIGVSSRLSRPSYCLKSVVLYLRTDKWCFSLLCCVNFPVLCKRFIRQYWYLSAPFLALRIGRLLVDMEPGKLTHLERETNTSVQRSKVIFILHSFRTQSATAQGNFLFAYFKLQFCIID